MLSEQIVLRMPPELQMADEQFFEFCQINRDLRIERNQFGELKIMPPTGSETGNREGNIFGQLWVWSEEDRMKGENGLKVRKRNYGSSRIAIAIN